MTNTLEGIAPMVMAKLAGKTALITGGNSGIGFATAQLFLAEGARVAITGKDSGRLAEAKTALGGKVETFTSNAARVGEIEAMAAEAKTKLGRIDVLFVNAGLASPTPFDEVSEAQYDDQFNVNIKGAFFTVQKLLPLLKDGASVILTSSTADEMGLPGLSVYCASKAALRSLVRSLTAELSSRRIRVNSIAPGPTETPIHGKMGIPAEVAQSMMEALLAQVPAARFAQPEEIAKVALFLASSDSSYVFGHELVADGGWVAV